MSSLRNLILAVAAATVSTLSFGQAAPAERAAENAQDAAANTGQAVERTGERAADAVGDTAERAGDAVERGAERTTDAVRSDTATSATTTTTTEVETEQRMRAPRADRN